MKFGKALLAAGDASQQTIASDRWMDYKLLKKKLKSLALVTDPALIKQGEQDFFAFFQSELKKVEVTFQELLVEAQSKTLAELGRPDTGDLNSDLARCTALHLFVLLVENYSVQNYCAFAKILKKHDKLTLLSTRGKVMERAVNNLSFARIMHVREILVRIEQRFDALESSSQHRTSPVSKSPASSSSRLQTTNSTSLPDRLSELASIAVDDWQQDVGAMSAKAVKRWRQVAAE